MPRGCEPSSRTSRRRTTKADAPRQDQPTSMNRPPMPAGPSLVTRPPGAQVLQMGQDGEACRPREAWVEAFVGRGDDRLDRRVAGPESSQDRMLALAAVMLERAKETRGSLTGPAMPRPVDRLVAGPQLFE